MKNKKNKKTEDSTNIVESVVKFFNEFDPIGDIIMPEIIEVERTPPSFVTEWARN